MATLIQQAIITVHTTAIRIHRHILHPPPAPSTCCFLLLCTHPPTPPIVNSHLVAALFLFVFICLFVCCLFLTFLCFLPLFFLVLFFLPSFPLFFFLFLHFPIRLSSRHRLTLSLVFRFWSLVPYSIPPHSIHRLLFQPTSDISVNGETPRFRVLHDAV